MSLPKVLLVEDDASIRRFVQMALDGKPIELHAAANLAAARQAIGQHRFELLICDLMLPDGSGLDLLRELQQRPGNTAPAYRAVFSAGISSQTRAALHGLSVWRTLVKPVSLAELCACVDEALNGQAEAGAAGVKLSAQEHSAVAEYFAGDHALFNAYRDSCQAQFAQDASRGDAALAACDLKALRLQVHSLKTVLLTLGDPQAAELARQVEALAAANQCEEAATAWRALRPHLQPEQKEP